MGNIDVASIAPHWAALRSWLEVDSEAAYDRATARLQQLLDEVGSDERHPLFGLLETLGTVMHAYELQREPVPAAAGTEVLQFLIDEHGLSASDLPEIGSAADVSAVLSGVRPLTVSQIHALSERFHVAPAVFV